MKASWRVFLKKLVDHPLLPILFISKVFETAAKRFVPLRPMESFALMAVITSALWVYFSDDIESELQTR